MVTTNPLFNGPAVFHLLTSEEVADVIGQPPAFMSLVLNKGFLNTFKVVDVFILFKQSVKCILR